MHINCHHLSSVNINQNHSKLSAHFFLIKKKNLKYSDGDVVKWEPLCPTDGNANCYSHLKIYEVLQKIKPKTAT
jgi:hypothetical protein